MNKGKILYWMIFALFLSFTMLTAYFFDQQNYFLGFLFILLMMLTVIPIFKVESIRKARKEFILSISEKTIYRMYIGGAIVTVFMTLFISIFIHLAFLFTVFPYSIGVLFILLRKNFKKVLLTSFASIFILILMLGIFGIIKFVLPIPLIFLYYVSFAFLSVILGYYISGLYVKKFEISAWVDIVEESKKMIKERKESVRYYLILPQIRVLSRILKKGGEKAIIFLHISILIIVTLSLFLFFNPSALITEDDCYWCVEEGCFIHFGKRLILTEDSFIATPKKYYLIGKQYKCFGGPNIVTLRLENENSTFYLITSHAFPYHTSCKSSNKIVTARKIKIESYYHETIDKFVYRIRYENKTYEICF